MPVSKAAARGAVQAPAFTWCQFPAPYWTMLDAALYLGDVRACLRAMPTRSVHCVVTSPPYWGLRRYLEAGHKDADCELGAEDVADCLGWATGKPCDACFVCHLVEVFAELKRVIRDDATVWLNLGDTFDSGQGMVPALVALALVADGWKLVQDIIWYSPNKMPESVTNRCTKSHEHIFLLAKGSDYYYDSVAIQEPGAEPDRKRLDRIGGANGHLVRHSEGGMMEGSVTVNKRDVWVIPTRGYPGAHFACVDAETEALTKEGWKKHTELKDGEPIVAYHRWADSLLWEPASFHRYDYDGDLIVYDKRDTSQWLTPNHRCLIQSRKGVVKVREAQSLKMSELFLMAAEMEEQPEMTIGEDMAALVGWFTSEGHVNYDRSGAASKMMACVSQSITANPEKVEIIRGILKRLNASYRYNESIGNWYDGTDRTMAVFSIGGMIGWKLVNELCTGNKLITDEMTRLPKNELMCLLDAFVMGDGCVRSDDGRMSIIQKDKRRLEQLQIIAIKLGYRALLTQRRDSGEHTLFLTTGRWLNVCGSGRTNSKERRHYKGVIWCPKVKSGFWLARRDGKPFITGNTFSPKLITPCILAGTSEHGVCASCQRPWERVVAKSATEHNYFGGALKGAPPGQAMTSSQRKDRDRSFPSQRNGLPGSNSTLDGTPATKETVGWRKVCGCQTDEVSPAIVLDPFVGSGTTVATALQLGRAGVGIDLSEKYLLENAIPRIEAALRGGMAPRKATSVVPPDLPPAPRRMR